MTLPDDFAETAEELYESAPCGYVTTLSDGMIIRANQTFLAWLGLDRADVIQVLKFQDLLSIGGRIFYETHLAPLLQMQGFVNEIALDVMCNGGRILPVFGNIVRKLNRSDSSPVHRITVINATDRRTYERELLAAKQKAEAVSEQLKFLNDSLELRVRQEVAERMRAEEAFRQAQKMDAIGQLTGGVAHDFNNLLTIVIGNIELIQRRLPPDQQKLRYAAGQAMEGASRAATLTQRLLAFARRQPLDPKQVDVNKLVSGMSELLQRTLSETVILETVLGGGVWRTLADANQLENALLNLAVNARDAMPMGGKLTIETANAALDDAYVRALVEPVPAGQYVLIAVSDTGTGMDPKTASRVFEPFFTTKEPGKGTGLGLSQVYGFVRQSNGHIRIYTELGEGTTIKIYLPRLHATHDTHDITSPNRPHTSYGCGETILVVEDERALREYAAETLRDLGYHVLEAGDAHQALAVFNTAKRNVDLLFTDVVLPGGINGRQIAARIQTLKPSVRVLYTTGYTPNAIVHQGRLDPATDVLGKPYTYTQLAEKVSTILNKDVASETKLY